MLTGHRAYLLVVFLFVAGSALVGPVVGWRGPVGADVWYLQALVMTAAVTAALVLRARFRSDRRRTPAPAAYADAWRELRRTTLSNKRAAGFAIVVGTYPLHVACYTGWKLWLNQHVDFTWDATLAQIGRSMHFGRHAWEYLAWSLPAARAVGVFYAYGWTLAVHGVTAWMALSAPSRRRTRFLVASALAWPLAGVVLAGLFMSAGPYFADNAEYAELIAALRRYGDTWAQDYLAAAYRERSQEAVGAGISAMPSMHMILAVLIACAVWPLGRWARACAVAFVALLYVACVILAWHYSLDLYVGAALAFGLWWVAGRIATHASRHPVTRARTPS